MANTTAVRAATNGGAPDRGDAEAPTSTRRDRPRPLRPHPLTIIVLLVSLGLVGVLAWASYFEYSNNEQRLLDLRVREAGTVLTVAVPTVQTPLAAAAELAYATNGDPQQFRQFVTPSVQTGQPFVSASLWSLQGGSPSLSVEVGATPTLAAAPAEAQALFAQARGSHLLSVIGQLHQPQPRVGYAYVTPGGTGRFAVYAESAIPPDRRLQIERTSAFSDLDYALYLGRPRPANLVATTLARLPVTGRHATTSSPFGDATFTLVMTARSSLSGTLPRVLPWIIAVAGSALAIGAAVVTDRLIRRRQRAEEDAADLAVVANENQRLYAEQRGIAEELQQAMLPLDLPHFPGVEIAVLYRPGVGGVDVGGDWYDVIGLDERSFLLVVGDVSGRGVRAATVMASLRYATRAYVAKGDPPGMILAELSGLLERYGEGHLATVLCTHVDLDRHEVTIANAGHLEPLLISGDEAHFVSTRAGAPVGVFPRTHYETVTVPVPLGATVVAFTDGLVERRGEDIDVGLDRLCQAALASDGSVHQRLGNVLDRLTPEGSDDDIAVVGVKWQT